MELIRKYNSSNRKLWSTKEKKYLTLQDIVDRVLERKDFRVLAGNGKVTKENDITAQTVKSALYHKIDMKLEDSKWLIRHLSGKEYYKKELQK